MAVEVQNTEELIKNQRGVISAFFGTEIPNPPDQLFEVAERIRQEGLFKAEPFYLPRRSFPEGITFPGQTGPMSPNLYRYIKEGWVDADANTLPGQWVILDVTQRPGYENGKQMYPDTVQFKELLAIGRELGDKGGIVVPDYCRQVPEDSRFAISPDEIDGSVGYVSKVVARCLNIEPDRITTPYYATFYYVGNLSHSEFGQANTGEWFRNSFRRGSRLFGGDSDGGGLAYVDRWRPGGHVDFMGFRLQVSFPSET